jgi:hypothetical protein
MDVTRLLPAPVASPSTLDGSSQSTALVHVTRQPLVLRSTSQSSIAYPGDDYVWTVSIDDNGSFNFYAAPRQNYGNNASGQSQDFSSGLGFASGWVAPQSSSVAAQYSLYASMANQDRGQYLDVYA